jgi:hypothetical protein
LPVCAIADDADHFDRSSDFLIIPLAGVHFDEALSETLLKVIFFGLNDAKNRWRNVTLPFGD